MSDQRLWLKVDRLDGQSWEQTCKEDSRFWRLRKSERKKLLAWARQEDALSARPLSTPEISTPPPETEFVIPDGMTPEEATREKIKRDAELYPIQTVTYVDLRALPIHELAKLQKRMVPPSRRRELHEYRNRLRDKEIAAKKAQAADDEIQQQARISQPEQDRRDVERDAQLARLQADSEYRAKYLRRGVPQHIRELAAVELMTSEQLEERLRPEILANLPPRLVEAICKRYLEIEGVSESKRWEISPDQGFLPMRGDSSALQTEDRLSSHSDQG